MRTQRLLSIFIFCLCVLQFSSFTQASQYTPDGKPTRLSLRISPQTPLSVDRIIHEALTGTGYEAEITLGKSATSLLSVNSGLCDGLVAQAAGFEDMYPNIVMVPESIFNVRQCVYAPINSELSLDSWESLSGLSVAIENERIYIETKLAEVSGIKSIIKKSNAEDLIQAVLTGEADVAIISIVQHSNFYTPTNIHLVGVLEDQPAYTYLNKQHEALVPMFAERYRLLKESNRLESILTNRDSGIDDEKNVILLISSYGSDTQPDDELKNALKSTISANSEMELYMLNLNANRYEDAFLRMESYAAMLRTDFTQRPPALIIATDAYALKFLQNYYYMLFNGVPFIYCGVDDNIFNELLDFSTDYITVPEKISAIETIDMMLKFYPDTDTIFIVNDYLLDGVNWRRMIENQLEGQSFTNRSGQTVEFEYNDNMHYYDLLDRLASLEQGTLVLTGFYFGGSDNNYQTEREIHKQFIAKSKVPIFGLNYAGFGYGEIGGKYIDRHKEGKAIGELAMGMLRGEPLEELREAAMNTSATSWFFDYAYLESQEADMSRLPKDATVINRILPFNESNPAAFYLSIVFAIFSVVLISWLLFFYIKLRLQNKELIQAQRSLVDANEVIKRDSEIRKTKERIETLIESSPIAYILTVDGVVKEVNNYTREHMGINVGDDIKKSYESLSVREQILAGIDRYGIMHTEVVRMRIKNGNINRYSMNVSRAPYGENMAYIIWGMDIERVEQQKDYYQKSQQDMEKVIDLLPLPMFIFSPDDFKLIYANRSFLSTFTSFDEGEDYVGFNVLQTFPKYQEDGTESANYVKDVCAEISSTGKYITKELTNILTNGNKIETRNYVAGITYKERYAITVIIQDVTDEKYRAAMLKNTADKEKEANQLKSRFIVNMSHEIRTPMNAIIGLSEIEINRPAHKDYIDVFQKINASAKILLAIINDILDFSKIEAEKMDLIEEEYEFEELLSVAMLTVSQRIANKKVEMMLKADSNLPKYVFGDKTKLWQILKNILDNSAKFTMIGNIRLTVDLLEMKDGIATVEFTIDDTGIGMTPAQIDRIFQPFEQFHNENVHVTGTGLGMTITKQLARLLGGDLEISSERHKGTQTRVILPLKVSRPELKLGNLPDGGSLKDKRILILDDDDIACGIMAGILNGVGALSSTVNKADEAFKKIISFSNKNLQFDVIIVDYLLDGQNGFEFVKDLRRMNISSAKLLMVSAYAKNILNFDIKEAGFVDLIDKPFIPSLFIQKICKAIGVYTSSSESTKKPQYPGAKILVCEDNSINQEVALGMLQSYGITPIIASNGREALGLLEAQSFDMIFMDIIMPIMNGHDAAVSIRNSQKPYRDIPIIAMTANAMKDEIDRCIMEGMNGHVPKPIEFDKLTSQLERWLPESLKVNVPDTPEAAHQKDGDEITIRGVNISEGLERFGGNRERYCNALKKFALSIPSESLPFDIAVSEDNYSETKRFAHTIKGTAGNLGVTLVYNYAKALDDSLKLGIPDRGAYELFLAAYVDVRNEILSKIGEEKDVVPLISGSLDECKALLIKLNEALSRFEPNACEKLAAQLKEKNWEGIDRKVMLDMCNKVDQYDYDDATKIIETIVGANP